MRKNVFSVIRQAKIGLITAGIGILSVSLPVAGIVTAQPHLAREKMASKPAITVSQTFTIETAQTGTQPLKSPEYGHLAASDSDILEIVNHEDILLSDRLLLDRTFKALPALCRDHVTNFYVNYAKNAPRGLSGAAGTMMITGNESAAVKRALVTHECGHIVDLAALVGTPDSGKTAYFDGKQPIYANDPSIGFYAISWTSASQKKAGSSDKDFVSGYAKTDMFEDFAESFAFYVFHQQEFLRLAQRNPALAAKYAWLAEHVFQNTPVLATSTYKRTQLAWDVTKLPYKWMQ